MLTGKSTVLSVLVITSFAIFVIAACIWSSFFISSILIQQGKSFPDPIIYHITAIGKIEKRKFNRRVLTEQQEEEVEERLRSTKENIISMEDARAALLEAYGESSDPSC
jgi:hypothetical protein